jgi:hypothetical protein
MSYQSNWNDDFILSDVDAAARGPRIPRDRPDRADHTGGGGGGAGGPASYLSGNPSVPDTSEYNVKIAFQGSWTAELKNAFIVAANAISSFIVGDLPNVGTTRIPIDDISLVAGLVTIDGAGGVLGQSGPTAFRPDTHLPSRGTMTFDIADANVYQAAGLFDDIVLHEMLHTLGFGTIWQSLGLIDGIGTATPTFNGAFANAAYPGTGLIAVEDIGSSTAFTHWDEDVFANELMTGYLDGDNELSYMTIASLGDLGYSTVSGASYVSPAFI